MKMSISIKVEAIRVSSEWWDVMVSNGVIDTSEDGDKTYKGYPIILDDTVPDIKFDFETKVI